MEEKIKDPIQVEKGKKNRKSGKAFELKVRKDLESKGWICSKWQNNVEFETNHEKENCRCEICQEHGYSNPKLGKLISAKHQFNFFTKSMSIGNGFPDFIAYKSEYTDEHCAKGLYEVIGVESKINGYLKKEEKEKCSWLLKNNIFSKILIAKKNKEGKIEYVEFEQNI